MIRLALVKDDVFFTKDSAYYMYLETRKGPWYKQMSRKWGGRDEYDMPPGLLLANQGDVSGPSCKFIITSYEIYVIYIGL
ncbi:GD18189 [Drosophila simulans]|uniref:GD18189 n=1 Tax=Drosophila simulans TaxID=7240 RepID=B4QVB8_DROSI|nr:GD18189 [Drosophila simulans]